MKKTTLKLLALMLACIMLLPLAIACDTSDDTTTTTESTEKPEPTEAEKFAALSENEKAFYVLSMDVDDGGKTSMDMTMDLSTTYMGYAITSTVSGKQVEINTGDKYADYSEMNMTISMMGTTTTMLSKEGYIDGRAFYYMSTAGEGEGYYVVMTKDQYIADFKDEEEDDDNDFGITKDNCQTVTCIKSGDNWVATFTDMTSEGLAEFKEFVEAFDGMVDPDSLTDVTLTLTISKDLKPVSAEVSFEFPDGGATLTMSCIYKFASDVTEPTVDMSDFQETDSLN